MPDNTPTYTPDPSFQTQIGWVTGKSPLSGWNYHHGLQQWIWFPEATAPRILVSGAGSKEANGVYTMTDGVYKMLGTDFYFTFIDKAGGFISLSEGSDGRMYYVSRVEEYTPSTNPASVDYWMTERGQLPKPKVEVI